MALRRMFEESRPKEEALEELKGIRAVFLGQLGQFGKESHERFPISWPLYKFLPPTLRPLIQPFPGKTTVNLKGEWQGKEVNVEVVAPALKSQIQPSGEIIYPVFIDVKMGEQESWYMLSPDLEESNSSIGSVDATFWQETGRSYPSCLELDKLAQEITANRFQVVRE